MKKGYKKRAQLFALLDRLIESVLMASDCTSTSRDKKGCSIKKIVEELYFYKYS